MLEAIRTVLVLDDYGCVRRQVIVEGNYDFSERNPNM